MEMPVSSMCVQKHVPCFRPKYLPLGRDSFGHICEQAFDFMFESYVTQFCYMCVPGFKYLLSGFSTTSGIFASGTIS